MTKHTNCVITFQKNNGGIIMRPRLGTYGLKIGDMTSMGWKVLDIHYQFYDGNYYHEEDYERKRREYSKKREPIKKRFALYLRRVTYDWI